MSMAAAAENVNAWNGTAMLLPPRRFYRRLVFGPISDNYYCFRALYLVSFAQGGHKPCVQAFGADQFDEEDEHESKAKSSFFNWWYFSMNGGILVALLVLNYIQENMSWELGFGIPCIAMCFALIIFLIESMTYHFHVNSDERNPFMRISRVFVEAVRNWRVASLVVGSIEEEAQQVLPHENAKFKFLDKAILTTNGLEENGNICSMKDIDDAKAILRLVPIWSTCLGDAIIFAQGSTLFTKQGATMDRYIVGNFQIPSASLQSLISLSIVVFIPIYDRVLVPIASSITMVRRNVKPFRRSDLLFQAEKSVRHAVPADFIIDCAKNEISPFCTISKERHPPFPFRSSRSGKKTAFRRTMSITKKPTAISMLQRIGIGIFLSFLSMHALVEKRRLSTAIQYGLVDLTDAMVPMSIWWLALQYMLFGIADVFTMIGLREFFYNQILGELKSIGLALYLSIFGIGSFLSSLLISIIEKVTSGNAGLSLVSMGIYLYFAKSYIYNKNDKI
ncbi:hypothetical protein CDL12_12774 [Handroanthus impetiginosus]|uniref:H+/oligopeptide symporter n=1 Tax=Handroanthus impetiginosus TaxID=429701 RepID=A0A2G9HAP3_9LAMI|nr:hypothetical protein CDL12_12774 [Handroanthus impetiginosus]